MSLIDELHKLMKEKKYTFAMNGQTGEIVGNIPLNIPKAIIMALILFVGIALIATVFLIWIGG